VEGNLSYQNALVGKLTPKESYGGLRGDASMTSLGIDAGAVSWWYHASYMGLRWPFVVVSLPLELVVIPII